MQNCSKFSQQGALSLRIRCFSGKVDYFRKVTIYHYFFFANWAPPPYIHGLLKFLIHFVVNITNSFSKTFRYWDKIVRPWKASCDNRAISHEESPDSPHPLERSRSRGRSHRPEGEDRRRTRRAS